MFEDTITFVKDSNTVVISYLSFQTQFDRLSQEIIYMKALGIKGAASNITMNQFTKGNNSNNKNSSKQATVSNWVLQGSQKLIN